MSAEIKLKISVDGSEKTEASLRSIGAAAEAAGQRAAQAFRGQIAQSAEREVDKVVAAWKTLGVRSSSVIADEARKMRDAFKSLRSAGLEGPDLDRASSALKQQFAALRQEMDRAGKTNAFAESRKGADMAAGAVDRLTEKVRIMGHLGAALTIAPQVLQSLAQMGGSLIAAQQAADKLANSLNYSVGAANVAREMDYLRTTARNLGLDYQSAAEGYSKFSAAVKGSGMTLAQTREVFEGVAQAAARFGLSADDTQGAFLALSQMASKGVVSAEEFRQQLAERLPGATQIAARALGVTTAEFNKLLESGSLIASDFLPKFGAALKNEITAPVNSLTQEINRLTGAWEQWKQALANADGGGFQWLTNGLNESAAAMRSLGKEAGVVQKLLMAIGGFEAGAIGAVKFDTAKVQEQAMAKLGGVISQRRALEGLGSRTAFESEALRGLIREEQALRDQLMQLAERRGKETAVLPDIAQEYKDQQSKRRTAFDAYMKDVQGEKQKQIAAEIERFSALTAVIGSSGKDYEAAYAAHQAKLAELRKGKSTGAGAAKNDAAETFAARLKEEQDYAKTAVEIIQEKVKQQVFSERQGVEQILAAHNAGYVEQAALLKKQLSGTKDAGERAKLNEQIIALGNDAKVAAEKAASGFAKIDQAATAASQKVLAGLADETNSLLLKAKAAEEENATIGKTSEQLAVLTAKRYEEQIAIRQTELDSLAGIEGREGERYAIEQQIVALERLKGAEIARPKLREQAREWEKFTDDINRALTDALMRGFEDGKSFGQNFVDSLKNSLKTAALKIVVQMVTSTGGSLVNAGINVLAGTSGSNGGSSSSSFSMDGIASSTGNPLQDATKNSVTGQAGVSTASYLGDLYKPGLGTGFKIGVNQAGDAAAAYYAGAESIAYGAGYGAGLTATEAANAAAAYSNAAAAAEKAGDLAAALDYAREADKLNTISQNVAAGDNLVQGANIGSQVGQALGALAAGYSAYTLGQKYGEKYGTPVGAGVSLLQVGGGIALTGAITGGLAGAGVIGAGAAGSVAAAGAAAGGIGAGALAGASAALAAIPVWGWAALAVLAIAGASSGGGGAPKVNVNSRILADAYGVTDKPFQNGSTTYGGGQETLTRAVYDQAIQDFVKAIAPKTSLELSLWGHLNMKGRSSNQKLAEVIEGGEQIYRDRRETGKGMDDFNAYVQDQVPRMRLAILTEAMKDAGGDFKAVADIVVSPLRDLTSVIADMPKDKVDASVMAMINMLAAFDQFEKQIGGDIDMSTLVDYAGKNKKTVKGADGKDTEETLLQSVDRVMGATAALANVFNKLGDTLVEKFGAEDIFNLADAFVKLFGTTEELTKSLDAYVANYYTEAEKSKMAWDQIGKSFAALNLSTPKTREEFRRLVEAQDLSTTAGQAAFKGLMDLQGAFAALTPEIGNLTTAAAARTRAAAQETQAARIADYLDAERSSAMAAQSAMLDAERSSAMAAQSAMLDSQASAAQSAADSARSIAQTFRQILDGLTDYRSSLLAGQGGALSAQAQYAAARQAFADVSSRARLGDATAAGNLRSVGDAFLAASRNVNGFGAYQADYGSVLGTVDSVIGVAERQIPIAEQQLTVAQAQLASLESIRASLTTAGAPTAESLPTIVTNYQQASKDWNDWFANTAIGETIEYDIGKTTRLSETMGLFTDLLGNAFTFSQSEGFYSLADKSKAFADSLLKNYGKWTGPSFAAGGYHSGGLRLVGEFGPELEFTGPSRILSATDTASLLGGAGLIDELRALRAEVSQLRAEAQAGQAAIAANTRKSASLLDKFDIDGLPEVRAA